MKHHAKDEFDALRGETAPLTMLGAIEEARTAIRAMTGQEIDGVVSCARGEDLNWHVALDVIESVARIGDNDLLVTYEVLIGKESDLLSFSRLRRYHREDREN